MRPDIILGSPGCGKTTALLNILDEALSRGVEPERIGFVSFTTKAAEEARVRAQIRFGYDEARLPWFRTLHSLCFRRMRLDSKNVLEGSKLQEFAHFAGVRITSMRWSEDGTLTGFERGDRIMHINNLSRVKMVSLRSQYNRMNEEVPWNEVERVVGALNAYKKEAGLYDYADFLQQFLDEGTAPDLEVLLVDESQDLSFLQWKVVEKIAKTCRRVVVAGDDQQAIFLWGGADVDYFVDLPGNAITLGQSYRVPSSVQELATKIIRPVKKQRPRVWAARQEKGVITRASDIGETGLDDKDFGGNEPPILILARNSYIIKEQVVPELRRQGVYYELRGKPSVEPAVLDAIQTWERLREGGSANVSECRSIYKHMTSGRGVARGFKELAAFDDAAELSLADLKANGGLLVDSIWREAFDRLPQHDVGYIVKMRQQGERLKSRPRVRVSTIHAAKGGEAEHVILMKEMAKLTYREMEHDQDAERRTWYVGVTRAKSKLTIVDAQTPQECPWL